MNEAIFSRANAAYEERLAAGQKVTIPEIEKEFGIEPKKLANWRSNQNYTSLDIDRLIENPDNSRTSMDPARLEGLAQSIRRRGVRQPLEVREVPMAEGEPQCYEVVTGNRRLRASKRVCADLLAEGEAQLLARRRVLPVRILTDEEAKEANERKYLELIENLQREDISPLDEASAYRWLVENHHDTPASIADQLGLTKPHVTNRMKLPDAPKSLLDALAAKLVATTQCELVGGIPGEAERERAALLILKPTGKWAWKTEPLNVVETKEMIRDQFMISLKAQARPGFDLDDATLVPEAGACGPCLHRAENAEGVRVSAYGTKQRGVDPMTCLNPDCARAKRMETLRRIAARTESEVLGEEACAAIFSGIDGAVAHDADYVSVEDLPDEISGSWSGPTYLGRNPATGDVVTLVEKAAARDLQRATKGRKTLDASVSEQIWNREGEWLDASPWMAHADLSEEERKAWTADVYMARNLKTGEVHEVVAKEDLAALHRKRKPKKAAPKEALLAMERLMEAIWSQGMEETDIDALTATELQETPAALAMFRAWLKPSAKDDHEAIVEMMATIGAKGAGASLGYLAMAILSYGLSERGTADPAYRAFAERFGVEG